MKESVVDAELAAYDPQVIASGNKLDSALRTTILGIAANYSIHGRITGVYMVGSMLTKQYTISSDIDITIVMEPYSEDALDQAQQRAINTADTQFAPRTLHPINFYVDTEFIEEKHDEIYDVLRNTWYKHTHAKPVDLDDYWSMFQDFVSSIDHEKAELLDDILEYDKLKALGKESHRELLKRINSVIAEIDDDVKKLSATHGVVHGLRKASFKHEMTHAEIKQYEIKNKLPANVLYKLLQRYSYLQFLAKIKQALKDAGGEIDTEQDVDIVKQAVKESRIRKNEFIYGILNQNLEIESRAGSADSNHTDFVWDMEDPMLAKRWRYIYSKKRTLFCWYHLGAEELQVIIKHIKQKYGITVKNVKTPDRPAGSTMKMESQIEKAIDCIVNEMTGAGAAGGYEMPLGATPYWKRRAKKKKITNKPHSSTV